MPRFISPLVLVLFIAVIAMGYIAVVPNWARARESYAIDLAGRALMQINAQPDMTDEAIKALPWPSEADLATLDRTDPTNAVITLTLPKNHYRVWDHKTRAVRAADAAEMVHCPAR